MEIEGVRVRSSYVKIERVWVGGVVAWEYGESGQGEIQGKEKLPEIMDEDFGHRCRVGSGENSNFPFFD